MLTWGIFAGAIMLLGSIKALGRQEPRWLYRWFRPWRPSGEAGFVRRVKTALSSRNHFYLLPLFSPLLVMGVILGAIYLLPLSLPAALVIGGMIGYAGAAAIAYPLDHKHTLSNYRKQIAIFAAQKLARRVQPAIANAILVPLIQSTDPALRIAAAMGLRELGTKEGSEALRLLGEDKETAVASAARDAYNDLHQVYQGKGRLSVRTMDTYVSEHAYLVKRLRSKKKKRQYSLDLEKFQEITRQIDEIVFSQLPLRRSFPDVYCQHCYARAEQHHYEEWDWVSCRQCKEVHGLQPGVRQAVGQIGGDVAWDLKGGTLHLNLWDDASRKARAADLDVLEIVGGKPIHYDWAVSAIVDKLHGQSLGVGSRIAVKLVGHPVLEGNSLNLLKTLDPSMVLTFEERALE
jgi:hypothetical protein